MVAHPGGPTRPPATIVDLLWNLHSVLEAQDGPLPIDQLKDAYSKHLGHKCAIERFLVVGDIGLAGTLKRIPHVVTVTNTHGQNTLTATCAKGSTREQLVQADQDYRKQLQQKNMAAKAGKAAPPAAAKTAPAAPAPAPVARPAEGGGEPDAKRQKTAPDAGDAGDDKKKTADQDTLSRMLVQGVVRVLQSRAKEGKGDLLVKDLAEEFKTLWKVPFNLASAGYTDVNTFLKAWPNKVEVSGDVVSLAKKLAEKAKSGAPEAAAAAPAKPTAPVPQKPANLAPANLSAADAAAPIPTTAAEITKELSRTVQRIEALAKRQKSLMDALERVS